MTQWDDVPGIGAPVSPLAPIEDCVAYGRRPAIRLLGEMVQHGKPFMVIVRTGADLTAFSAELVRHGYRLLVPWVVKHARVNEFVPEGDAFIVDIAKWNAGPSRAFDLTGDGQAHARPKGDADAPPP